jgi:hypothetical protein
MGNKLEFASDWRWLKWLLAVMIDPSAKVSRRESGSIGESGDRSVESRPSNRD